MLKKRVLTCLLVVMTVLSVVTINVFAISDEKEVLLDSPYDYGVVPFSEEWEELTTLERKAIFTIPKKVAESLTTEALLKTILDNPYIIDLFAYNDFSMAVKLRNEQFQIKELLSRPDFYLILTNYVNSYSKSITSREAFFIPQLNKTSLSLKNSIELQTFVFDSIRLCFMKNIENNALTILNVPTDSFTQTRSYTGFVYTNEGAEVPCVFNKTWEEWVAEEGVTASESFAITKMAGYRLIYSGLTQVAGLDPSYNCHSFAWHASTINNNVWIDDTLAYRLEASLLEDENDSAIREGTKVMYFGYYAGSDYPSYYHSANVYELNTNGSIKTVISKWGTYALVIHDIDECPYSTGSHTLSYYNY